MVKAKNGKTVVGSYKTISEAAEAMVLSGKASNINSAKINISNALRGFELRSQANHRFTAYGYSWSQTAVKVTSSKKTSTVKAAKKTVKTSKKSR